MAPHAPAPSIQLLEINLMSAQDLAPISRSMRTYAVAWVNPERKLITRVDQTGHANPTWNEKFVFRVDSKFLRSETAAIMIEIYAAAWLRDVVVGSVRVLVSNLFAPMPSGPEKVNHASSGVSPSSAMRFVALQVRRPSGRPQGILNVGVTLLSNTMRSMPLYTELTASAVGFHDLIDVKAHKQPENTHEQKTTAESKMKQLRRTQSDKTDLTTDDNYAAKYGSVYNGSIVNGSMVNGSELNGPKGDSIVNGSLISDVGPSASVVAAAIARGLYLTPGMAARGGPANSVLDDWTDVKESEEGLRSKLERWRNELPPLNDHEFRKLQSKRRRLTARRRTTGGSGGGLFSCFGNAFGCEISITCGGSNGKRRYGNGKVCNLSSVDGSQSYI